MIREAKGIVKRSATLLWRYCVLCVTDYLLIRWNSSNFQLAPTVSSSRPQVLLPHPVNNKHTKVAVYC